MTVEQKADLVQDAVSHLLDVIIETQSLYEQYESGEDIINAALDQSIALLTACKEGKFITLENPDIDGCEN